ncbi:MAG: hypothetical protein IPM29_23245 [Planctomycetes bacterium]|nr:hypothetical protein [Planctomycetota bacterium]
MTDTSHTRSWPDLAIGLYDRLTGRNAEITYEMDGLRIKVPSGTGDRAEHAEWTIDGTLRVRTRDLEGGRHPN